MKKFKTYKPKKQEVKKSSLTRTQIVMVQKMARELQEQGEGFSEVIANKIVEKSQERNIFLKLEDVLDVISGTMNKE